MKLPAHRYRSPLGNAQPRVTDLEAMKRSGWLQQQILVISETDERLDFIEREIVRRIGERLYGGARRD
jgi:hypothetical protein